MLPTPNTPTDGAHDDDQSTAAWPIADIATAIAGAAITSAPAIATINKTVRSTLAVVQPAVSNWLRIAAGLCRFRFSG